MLSMQLCYHARAALQWPVMLSLPTGDWCTVSTADIRANVWLKGLLPTAPSCLKPWPATSHTPSQGL